MGNAVSAKAADEREAQRKQERKQKREKKRQRRLLKQKPKSDESGIPLDYDKQGNQLQYDSKGNPFYIDDSGSHFYLDDHGAPFYLDEKGELYYLDENRERFYLDENREPFYLDGNGQKYFLDTDGKTYYFDENGNPYLADNQPETNAEDADNQSDVFKERRMGFTSAQSSRRTISAPFSGKEMQIRSPATPFDDGTSNSERSLAVIDHCVKTSFSEQLMLSPSPVTPLEVGIVERKRPVEIIDHRQDSPTSSKCRLQTTAESVQTETESVDTESLSSYSSLSFTKSEFEQEIAITPDYIKDDTIESETRRTAQIEAENKILKKQLTSEREREPLPAAKSFRKVGTFSIKLPDDTKDCSVIGQAFLPDGNLVIADLSNRKLKVFDSELEPCTSYTVDYIPQGLCSGSKDNLLHMTFKTRMFNGINILKIDNKSISSQQTVRTKGIPYGIARSNEGIAVTISEPNGWKIHLMDLKGKISKVIDLENNYLKLTNPENITITKNLRLFVSDWGSNSIYCLDTDGEEVFQYQQLREPKGVCIDNKGSIFIASPGVVHQISTSGERVKALMRRETTGFALHGVCYDSEDGLMVLTGQSNNVVAYELTE